MVATLCPVQLTWLLVIVQVNVGEWCIFTCCPVLLFPSRPGNQPWRNFLNFFFFSQMSSHVQKSYYRAHAKPLHEQTRHLPTLTYRITSNHVSRTNRIASGCHNFENKNGILTPYKERMIDRSKSPKLVGVLFRGSPVYEIGTKSGF